MLTGAPVFNIDLGDTTAVAPGTICASDAFKAMWASYPVFNYATICAEIMAMGPADTLDLNVMTSIMWAGMYNAYVNDLPMTVFSKSTAYT